MINKVILVGNLGADPETRTTSSGMAVSKLRIATTERVKKGEQWEDHTEWHRVTCFGRTAENVQKFLKKGRQVYVEGKLRTTKYQNKDGQDTYSTEVICDIIQFLGSGRDQGAAGGGRDEDRGPRGGGGGGGGGDEGRGGGGGYGGGTDEDIPF